MLKLSAIKLVVLEPHNVSGEVFEEAITTYRQAMLIVFRPDGIVLKTRFAMTLLH